MKTGKNVKSTYTEKYVKEFYITLIGLEAILKRVSLKDAVLFVEHNPSYLLGVHIMDSAVCFNLFSDYGVGTELKPLIINLLNNSIIQPHEFENNIFFKEIINLVPEIDNVRATGDIMIIEQWMNAYCTKHLVRSDDISRNRMERLLPLFKDEDVGLFIDFGQGMWGDNNKGNNKNKDNNNKNNNSNEIEIELCLCNFCKEFSKYTYPKEKHINSIISDVIYEIDREYTKV